MGPSPSPSSSVAVDILVFFGSGSCGEDGECSMLEATEMEIARFNELSTYSNFNILSNRKFYLIPVH